MCVRKREYLQNIAEFFPLSPRKPPLASAGPSSSTQYPFVPPLPSPCWAANALIHPHRTRTCHWYDSIGIRGYQSPALPHNLCVFRKTIKLRQLPGRYLQWGRAFYSDCSCCHSWDCWGKDVMRIVLPEASSLL
jgi:hypothetical protein